MDSVRKKRPTKGKSKQSKFKEIASLGGKKAKEAGKFIYDNREKIGEAVKLVAAVVAVASEIFGKPGKPRRRK
jgi:hypothetical protein